jgi:D-glycero-D-manno-heptose 1,7-bisphosphate phosphatase
MNQLNILFVDIDGTLTTTKSGKPFKQSPDDIKPLPGSQKAITHFANRGYKIYGVSNQGGCDTINKVTGTPFKSIDDAIKEMQNTLVLFPEIDTIFFCPAMDGQKLCVVTKSTSEVLDNDSQEDFASFRKPATGMIKIAFPTFRVNKSQSLFVGDREEDRQCAATAGIPFMEADMWRFEYGGFV